MVYPKILAGIYKNIENAFRATGLIAGKSGRHMKYPYTLSAKIAQFPLFYYMRHNNIWMYYPLAILLGFYPFLKIHNLVNSDANKASWAESQRKAAEKEHH